MKYCFKREMEGVLKVYTNLLQGWTDKYFVLQDGILTYYAGKGKEKEGTIHMKVSSIKTKDPRILIINSGTTEIEIKAGEAYEYTRWLNELRKAQNEALLLDEELSTQEKDEINKKLAPKTKQLLADSRVDTLKKEVAELWCSQAIFEEVMSLIAPKIESNPGLLELAQKLERIGSEIKGNVTMTLTQIEEEKRKLGKTLCNLEADGKGIDGKEVNLLIRRQEENIMSNRGSLMAPRQSHQAFNGI